MTLKDLGPQALVSKNIYYQQHQFLMRGLGNMSSDGHTGDSMLTPNFFGKYKSMAKIKVFVDRQTNRQKYLDLSIQGYKKNR
jgi:hypothetical protein